MSYKYNHSIQFDLDHLSQYEDVVGLEEKKRELDHVYAQAAKAYEYEAKAKAKAFDAICKAHVPLEKRMSPVTVDEGLDFAVETEKIILKIYESGGYDA